MHDHRAAISRRSVARPARHKSDRIPALVPFGRRRFVRRMLSARVRRAGGISAADEIASLARRCVQTFAEWDKITDTNSFFSARCYGRARPLPSCGVCLSVRPAARHFVYCVKTSNHILKLFHHWVATPF